MAKATSNSPGFANRPTTSKFTGSSPITSVTVASPNRSQALQILRGLAPDEGFHFYFAENRPAGVSALSLGEFLEKLSSVQMESVDFHFYRGDFERWIDMLGDDYLAPQIAELRGKSPSGEELRSQLVDRVEARYGTLTKASAP